MFYKGKHGCFRCFIKVNTAVSGGEGYGVAGGAAYGDIVWPTTAGSGGGGSHAGAGGAAVILNVGQVSWTLIPRKN